MRSKPQLLFALLIVPLAVICAVCSGTESGLVPIQPIVVGAVDLSTGDPESRLQTFPADAWSRQATDQNYSSIYSGKLLIHKLSSSSDSASAQFTVPLPMGGAYKLAIWYPKVTNKIKLSSTLYVDVNTGDGVITCEDKKPTSQGQWHYLGTFYFPEGSGAAQAKVTIRGNGPNSNNQPGQVIPVDAICLSKVYPSLVVPSAVRNNSPYYSWSTPTAWTNGTWNKKIPAPYNKGKYLYRAKRANADLTLSANLTLPGDYHVYLWFPQDDRLNVKKEKVSISGLGKSPLRLNLTQAIDPDSLNAKAGQWNYLGTYRFPDAHATLTFSDADDASPGDVVVADAVRFDKAVCSEVVVDSPNPDSVPSDKFSCDALTSSITVGKKQANEEFGGSWLSIAAPAEMPRPTGTFLPTPASTGRNSVLLWWNDNAASGDATVSCPSLNLSRVVTIKPKTVNPWLRTNLGDFALDAPDYRLGRWSPVFSGTFGSDPTAICLQMKKDRTPLCVDALTLIRDPGDAWAESKGYASGWETDSNTANAKGIYQQSLEATSSIPLPVTIKTSPPTPPWLTIVSGNNQTGTVSSALNEPLRVKVVESPVKNAKALANYPVTFSVKAGGGGLPLESVSTVYTDQNGFAEVVYKAGLLPGVFTVSAVAGAAPYECTVTFTGQSNPVAVAVSKIADASYDNNLASVPGIFRFTRTGCLDKGLTVNYRIDTLAGSGVDYLIPSQTFQGTTVTFPAYQATVDLSVIPIVAAKSSKALAISVVSSIEQPPAYLASEANGRATMQLQMPTAKISGGSNHTLSMGSDGSLYSWGFQANGRLGNGRTMAVNASTLQLVIKDAVGPLIDAIAISGGESHSLVVDRAGSVYSFGKDSSDKSKARLVDFHSSGITPTFVNVAAGNGYSVALSSLGDLWAWSNTQQAPKFVLKSSDAKSLEGIHSIAAWGGGALAQGGNGKVWSWKSGGKALEVPNLDNVVAVAAGRLHSVALCQSATEIGTVWCWGSQDSGQMGNGILKQTTTEVKNPDFVRTSDHKLDRIVQIAAGRDHTLALDKDGKVWAWGSNKCKQLGDPAYTALNSSYARKVAIPADVPIIFIGAGGDSSYAIDKSGQIYSWGYNGHGELGIQGNTVTPQATPQTAGKSTVVAVGVNHSLSIKQPGGALFAWGNNQFGQLGTGNTVSQTSPVWVSGTYISVAGGAAHTVAVRRDGTVWAWGKNDKGQLGQPTGVTQSATPLQVPGLSGVVAVAAGLYYSAALKADGTVWAWGANEKGQLGVLGNANFFAFGARNSDPVPYPTKIMVPNISINDRIDLANVVSIAAGPYQLAVLTNDGTVYGCGTDASGIVWGTVGGPSYNVARFTECPHKIGVGSSVLANIMAISAGSMGLSKDGKVYVWGPKPGSGPGAGSVPFTIQQIYPGTQITAVTGNAIASGSDCCFAIKNGTVWAWGKNTYGQLGQGNLTDVSASAPKAVPNLTQAVSVAAWTHTLVVTSSGAVYGFGDNASGQTGVNGNSISSPRAITLPLDPNGDNDGDGVPNWMEDLYGTNPNASDSDGDQVSDLEEIAEGSNPTDPMDTPSNSNQIPVKVGVKDPDGGDDAWIVQMQIADSNGAFTGPATRVVDNLSNRAGGGSKIVYLPKNKSVKFTLQRPEAGQSRGTDEYVVSFEPQGHGVLLPQSGNSSLSGILSWTGANGDIPPDPSKLSWGFRLLPVEVVDKDKKPATSLKVAKMETSLDENDSLNIDKDSDRFYVRMPGAANITGGLPAKVKISTVENPVAAYNDNPTKVEMIPDGNDLISKSLLLVSNDKDDDYTNAEIGEDDKDDVNDRTLKVQLRGKFKVDSVTVGGKEIPVNLTVPVPARKRLDANLIFLGETSNSAPAFQRSIEIVREAYAQVGIDVHLHTANLPVPPGVNPNPITDSFGNRVPEDVRKIVDAAATAGLRSKVLLFVVPSIDPPSAGSAYIPKLPGEGTPGVDPEYMNVAIINAQKVLANNRIYTLAHELGHILTGNHHYGADYPVTGNTGSDVPGYLVRHNLMMGDGTSSTEDIGSSKRLYQLQQGMLHEEFFTAP